MARELNKLKATAIGSKPKGRYSDGGGLYLLVKDSGSRSWEFRWRAAGQLRNMGLGGFHSVPLAQARKLATICREQIASGLDPRTERDREREALRNFGAVADDYLTAMAGKWTNGKTAWQWQHVLLNFAAPLRLKAVSAIETADILRLLKPIWLKTPETAAKARMRLEAVLDYAKAKGWRDGENPARWKGHLANILPPRQKLTKGHYPAMPYGDLPAFYKRLKNEDALSARGLEFLILTAARTGEVLGATWDEIDLDGALWVIPAARMKAKRDHRVPLSKPALALVRALAETRTGNIVFPGQKPKMPLSNMAFSALLKRMYVEGATPHGFRSSFRDWAGDCTSFPREVAEAALAHKAGDSTEQAYRRSDALEKRRKLMSAWADFCTAQDRPVLKLVSHGQV